MSTPRTETDYSGRGMVVDVTAAFAGVMLILTALFDVLQGVAAIANPDFFAAGSDWTYRLDVTAWGWVHLALGAVAVVVGVAILRGVAWGLVAGMVMAALSALTNFASLPSYPWWSMTIIALDVLVIWALSAQLRDRR